MPLIRKWFVVWDSKTRGSVKTVIRSKNYFQYFKKPDENTMLIMITLHQLTKRPGVWLWQGFYCLYMVTLFISVSGIQQQLMLLSDMLVRIVDLIMLMCVLKKMENSVVDKRILKYGGICNNSKTSGEKFGNYYTY